MKAFKDTYDFSTAAEIDRVRREVVRAHGIVQQLENGAKATTGEKIQASYEFMRLLGFYPKRVVKGGESMEVTGTYLQATPQPVNTSDMHKIKYEFKYEVKGTTQGPASTDVTLPLFGKHFLAEGPLMSMGMFYQVLDRSWPETNTVKSVGLGDKLHQVAIREGGYSTTPLACGSAVCSDEVVAHMQAYLRMLHSWLTNSLAAMLSAENNVGNYRKAYSGTFHDVKIKKSVYVAGSVLNDDAADALKYRAEAEGRKKYGKVSWFKTVEPTPNPWPMSVHDESHFFKPNSDLMTPDRWKAAIEEGGRLYKTMFYQSPLQAGKSRRTEYLFRLAEERKHAVSYLESVQNGDAVPFNKLKFRRFDLNMLKGVFEESVTDMRKSMKNCCVPYAVINTVIAEYKKKVFGEPPAARRQSPPRR